MRRRARLLTDTEPRKDASEQIIAGELAGDLIERRLRAAQLLGHELPGTALGELALRLLDVPARAPQGLEVPEARADRTALDRLKAHAAFQVHPQLFDPRPGECRDVKARGTGHGIGERK